MIDFRHKTQDYAYISVASSDEDYYDIYLTYCRIACDIAKVEFDLRHAIFKHHVEYAKFIASSYRPGWEGYPLLAITLCMDCMQVIMLQRQGIVERAEQMQMTAQYGLICPACQKRCECVVRLGRARRQRR